jgi:hypothetical protein
LEETRKCRKELLGETQPIAGRNKKKKCRKESLGETQSIVGRNKKKNT